MFYKGEPNMFENDTENTSNNPRGLQPVQWVEKVMKVLQLT